MQGVNCAELWTWCARDVAFRFDRARNSSERALWPERAARPHTRVRTCTLVSEQQSRNETRAFQGSSRKGVTSRRTLIVSVAFDRLIESERAARPAATRSVLSCSAELVFFASIEQESARRVCGLFRTQQSYSHSFAPTHRSWPCCRRLARRRRRSSAVPRPAPRPTPRSAQCNPVVVGLLVRLPRQLPARNCFVAIVLVVAAWRLAGRDHDRDVFRREYRGQHQL